MAEIFSAVASGAGLFSLTLQLAEGATKIKRLYDLSKNAPARLLTLSHELETLVFMLQQLQERWRLDSSHEPLLTRCVAQCEQSAKRITDLVDRLENRINRLKGIGKYFAALPDGEVKDCLSQLEQSKTTLMLVFDMFTE